MANSDRRKEYTDRNGNMFIPMNVEGGVWNEHFITTPKFICIVLMILALVIIIMELAARKPAASFFQYVIWIGLWAIVSFFVVRFVIFEEKFYYKMYKEMQKYEITTPAVFWNISSIKDTDNGGIITYSDARVGIIVKLDRDTITGKTADFKETHYDAISDFYRAVNDSRYSFIQMNIMEQAGKDPRLNELSKLVNKSDNPSIRKLMELEIGHIKNITNTTLYESDYFLFYTNDLSKVDTIIDDIGECLLKIFDGAFIGYSVLGTKEIVELVKELYGVKYFNSTQASLFMFDFNGAGGVSPININSLVWTDGNMQKLTSAEINKLRKITSEVIRETRKQEDVSLKATLYKVNNENKFGIDLDDDDSTEHISPVQKQNNAQVRNSAQVGNSVQVGNSAQVQNAMNNQQMMNNNQQVFDDNDFVDDFDSISSSDDETIDF